MKNTIPIAPPTEMKTFLNYVETPGEDLDYKTSLTIPDDSMSIQELLERNLRGETLAVGKKGYYDTELSEHLTHDDAQEEPVDLSDLTELSQQLQEIQNQIKNQKENEAKQIADDLLKKEKNDDELNDDEKNKT